MAREDRNPSPPPSLLEDRAALVPDVIGDTVYSKRWVTTTLMNVIKAVEGEARAERVRDAEGNDRGVDISDELEQQLSQLWDMSTDKDVAGYIEELNGINILLTSVANTNAPRLCEICLGILGNIAIIPHIRGTLNQSDNLVGVVFYVLEGTDTAVLVEASRLLRTCLVAAQSDPPPDSQWRAKFKEVGVYSETFSFILKSSSNIQLIGNLAECLYTFMDLESQVVANWSTPKFILSLVEAIRQVGWEEKEATDTLFHCLQFLSCYDSARALGEEESLEAVVSAVIGYLKSFLEEEEMVVEFGGREGGYNSAMGVLASLLEGCPAMLQHLEENPEVVRDLVEFYWAVKEAVEREMADRQILEVEKAASGPAPAHHGMDLQEQVVPCLEDGGQSAKVGDRSQQPEGATASRSAGKEGAGSLLSSSVLHTLFETIFVELLSQILVKDCPAIVTALLSCSQPELKMLEDMAERYDIYLPRILYGADSSSGASSTSSSGNSLSPSSDPE